MTTFHLINFGCRASQADGSALKRQMTEAGFSEAADSTASDVAVLNTCTVTAAADAEVRQMIRRIHRQNPRCRILVTGCYAQRASQEIAALDGVAWVVGNSHKHRVTDILRQELPGHSHEACPPRTRGSGSPQDSANLESGMQSPTRVSVGEIAREFHFAPVLPFDRTRPTVKVQDGCDARCAFCIIPAVRGPSRSLAPDRVVSVIQELARQGSKEVVLSGINLGSYGRDLDRSISFLGLVERILSETSIARLRLSSIEPMDVTPELVRLSAGSKRFADHFHVPLQSGSDRILRLMNRRYWTRHYADKIMAVHEALPQAGIGADVMVGFPGETDEDHRASANFIFGLPFTYLHIFPYSARPGTPAAARPDQVPGRVAHERAQELRAIIAGKRQAFLEAQIGRTLSALTLADGFESGSAGRGGPPCPPACRGQVSRRAITSNYLPVSIEGSDLPANVLVDVQIGRVHDGVLHGFPLRAPLS